MAGVERLVVGLVALATAGAAIADYAGAPALATFGLATLALAGLAWTVSFATEQVGGRLGPGATGVLQSTLGNLPEFFVVLFALNAGKTVVAQTSIIGSIFANALLVLGLVIVAGVRASDDGVMRFRSRLPMDTATLLLLAVFIIVLVGLSVGTTDKASHHVKAISIVGAVCLLVVYIAWVVPYLRTDVPQELPTEPPRVPLSTAAALLVAGGVGSAFVSDWFVASLSPSMRRLGLSDAFAGLVVVAIAGNAVENVAGIVLAAKGKADLAISVVKNSVAQVAAFLFPVLILVSLFFATPLTFSLKPVYIGALGLTAISVWQITGDGESTLFEGFSLVALYVILATVTLYE
ncbi:MAG: sodium:proton exchanger [Actinobacteria bacterium]|nr:MAG: sodium:proton exchanger [Actinomycetota bacterium]